MKKDITQLQQKQKGIVVEILGGCGLQKKLDAMGIRIGVEIVKVSLPSFKGPVVISVGNSQVALGYGMAKKIIVEV
ncbi:MAG: ferrous iron transport protein A [Endomicrobiia bacterium]